MRTTCWLLLSSLAACSSAAPTPGGADVSFTWDAVDVSDAADAQADTPTSADAVDASVDVSATGKCPTAVVQVVEGEAVVPQTILHLNGASSFADPSVVGGIPTWQWTVQSPKGSASAFLPNDHVAAPTFQTNVAGKYTFCLDVWDLAGQRSCEPSCQVVNVLLDAAIAVELYWPITPDAATSTQLDLHFAHPYAVQSDLDGDGKPDPWYDPTYDCFWANLNPNWGSLDPDIDDDPHSGADNGVQHVRLALPEDGHTYSVGVHDFQDAGFGATAATLNIYVYGQLVWNMTSTPLQTLDLWYAARISWPDGEVTTMAGKPGPGPYASLFITPCYKNPTFVGLGADPTACAKP